MRMPFTQSLGTLAVAVVLISHRQASAQPTVHEVQIAASKYQFTPSTIQVTAGEPVRLIIRSMDRVHGFKVPKLKIETQVPKGGDPVTVEFVAPAAGRYEIACSEFCGIGHHHMKAMLVSTQSTQTSQ